MSFVHAQIAQSMVLYFTLVGLWGVFLGLRRKPLDGAYRGALILAEGLGVVQLLVGLGLLLIGTTPADDTHYLYGLSAVLTLPLVYYYLVVPQRLSAPLAFGIGCLFMAGLAQRGITTGYGL